MHLIKSPTRLKAIFSLTLPIFLSRKIKTVNLKATRLPQIFFTAQCCVRKCALHLKLHDSDIEKLNIFQYFEPNCAKNFGVRSTRDKDAEIQCTIFVNVHGNSLPSRAGTSSFSWTKIGHTSGIISVCRSII